MVWESETDGNPSVDADESRRRRLDRTLNANSIRTPIRGSVSTGKYLLDTNNTYYTDGFTR